MPGDEGVAQETCVGERRTRGPYFCAIEWDE